MEYSGKYLTKAPTEADVLSAFAGIRPLVNSKGDWKRTSTLSRDHIIMISDSNLLSVAGGKWTTYRKIGEDTIDRVANLVNLPRRKSKTKHLPLHGSAKTFPNNDEWSHYGADAPLVLELANHNDHLLQKLRADLPCRPVDVIWAVRHEMARKVEDVLSRRTRSLLLGAKASMEIAPQVASIMAKELGRSDEWEKQQVLSYHELVKRYRIGA